MLAVALKRVHPALKETTIVLLASFAIALSGLLSFRLPISCVPITFQVSVALFIGASLGSKRGFFAILAFLLEGAMGLPVFASGTSGIMSLLGPTGGYLLGYLLGGTLAGFVAERMHGKRGMLLALLAGNLVVYYMGAAWLTHFVGSVKAALVTGVAPFIVGDLCKNLMFTQLKRRRLPFSF
jgi:biotin transport system substrate-specific component